MKGFVSGWVNDSVIGRVSERFGDRFGKRMIEIFCDKLAEMLGKRISMGNG